MIRVGLNEPSEKERYLERSLEAKRELFQQVCRLADYMKEGKQLSEFEPDLRLQLRTVEDLLMHSSTCLPLRPCHYPKCRDGMALTRHFKLCKQANICELCKSMARFFNGCREMKERNLKRIARRKLRRNEIGLRKQLHLMRICRGGGPKEDAMNVNEERRLN